MSGQQDVPTSWQALAFGRTASSTSLERDASCHVSAKALPPAWLS